MGKYKGINFLKEERKEEKYFKCTLIILIYILIFQIYINIKNVNNLKNDINNLKLVSQPKVITNTKNINTNTNGTFIKDTNKIYIEGKCDNLNILDGLKTLDYINKFSLINVENKEDKLYFNVICDIGGI